MSTYVYAACLDHTPPLTSEGELDQHLYREGVLDKCIAMVKMCLTAAQGGEEWFTPSSNDYWMQHAWQFMKQHPHCRLALYSENGDWIDIGHGVPADTTCRSRTRDAEWRSSEDGLPWLWCDLPYDHPGDCGDRSGASWPHRLTNMETAASGSILHPTCLCNGAAYLRTGGLL